MASRTLQQLLDAHYPPFAETHPLPDYVRDAVHALRSCRTAALGGHVQACPEGHVERVWYNSCRYRFCPQCTQLQIAQWLAKQQARLLSGDHYHSPFGHFEAGFVHYCGAGILSVQFTDGEGAWDNTARLRNGLMNCRCLSTGSSRCG